MSGDGRVILLKLKQDPRVLDPQKVSLKCTDEDGNENKEELPIFADGSPPETLFMLIDGVNVLEERYSWSTNSKGKLMWQHLPRALRGTTLKVWNTSVKTNRTYTLAKFKEHAAALIEEKYGESVYQDQIDYIENARQPRDMSSTEYVDRLAVINMYLPYFEANAEEKKETDLIKIITKNIKSSIAKDFIMQGGDQLEKLKDVKKLLRKIDRANNAVQKATNDQKIDFLERELAALKATNRGGEGNTGDAGAGAKGTSTQDDTNMCRLNGHKHKWNDCPNNPKSKNYNGTSFRDVIKAQKEARANGNKESISTDDASSKNTGELRFATHTGGTSFSDNVEYLTIEDDHSAYEEESKPFM